MFLPVTAVKKYQQRRIRGCRRKKVENFILTCAPSHIVLVLQFRCGFLAASHVIREERIDRRNANTRRIFALQLVQQPFAPQIGFRVHRFFQSSLRDLCEVLKADYSSPPPARKDLTCEVIGARYGLACRLLLRQAVQRPKSPDKVYGMNSNDGAVRKQLTQNT